MDTIIATHELSKIFSGRVVVNRISLAVPRGAIFALLGGNGAGKSTTIKMLTGMLPPGSGRAEILGRDCWSDAISLRHRIGYVPERPRFYDWMTVRDIGWFTAGFHKSGFGSRYDELVRRFRLDPSAKLKTLSKGGYAKVGLALALAPDPEVLILDEPTSGLDLFIRREFLASMVELAGAGRTILLSSHGIAEVERVVSHVGFMAEGRLLLAASIEELRKRIVRVRLRFEGLPPDPDRLGQVLEFETSGHMWQAVLQDPDRLVLDDLRQQAGILDVEETPLTLEEMYTALLTRFHHPSERGSQEGTRGSQEGARGERGNSEWRVADRIDRRLFFLAPCPSPLAPRGGGGAAMIRVLMWKEYREHRAIWVTLALAGSAGLYGLSQLLGPVWGLSYRSARESLLSVAVLLAWSYGLICGAMLLANEAETGTMTFLDMLPVRRLELWLVKALFGLLLLLSQVAVLMSFVVGLGITETPLQLLATLMGMLVFGLFAMSWSLLFSARGENVLNVIGLSFVGQIAGIMAASIVFAGFAIVLAFLGVQESQVARVLFGCMAFGGLTAGPIAGSARLFTQLDRQRGRGTPLIPRRPREMSQRASWGRLLWLSYAQMRRFLLGLLLFALGMSFFLLIAGPIAWPILTLFIGVLCGVTVWSDEQLSASFRFLGDQRFPLGRVWIVKVGLRFLLAVAAAIVLLLPSLVVAFLHHLEASSRREPVPFFADALHSDLVGSLIPIGIHLWLWLLYGFSVGQLCGMLFRKSLVAGVVALGTAGLLVCLWVPSLLGIGLHFWQVAGVPLALLAAGYLLMPAWAADRLLGRDTLLRLGSALLVAGLWIAGGIWYRIAEIDNVPDQFDMPAYVAGIPTLDKEKNPAGVAIRSAWPQVHALSLGLHSKRVGEPLFPDPPPGDRDTFFREIDQALSKGWPKRSKRSSELDKWLDFAFKEEWYGQLAEAATKPLGAVENLKQMTFNDRLQPWGSAVDITRVLAVRGLQQQVGGDPRTFVDNLNISLALARNLQHYAPLAVVQEGWRAEHNAIAALDRWLEKLSDHPELLERMRDILLAHEAQLPDDSDVIKASYLIAHNSLELVPDKLIGLPLSQRMDSLDISAKQERLQAEIEAAVLFWRVPWEYARHERILRVAFQEAAPFSQAASWKLRRTHKWGGDPLTILLPLHPQPRNKRDLALLHAAQLKVALRLYQTKNHGQLPPTLDDLVPGYLSAIPLDPFDGKPFRYRISTGEKLAWSTQAPPPALGGGVPKIHGKAPAGMPAAHPPHPPNGNFLILRDFFNIKVVPDGQAILWSVGEDERDDGGKRQGLENVAQPNDLIYLVPPLP